MTRTNKGNEATMAINKKYGEFASFSGNVQFDARDVPEKLVPLIPYARFWGVSDDWAREQLAEKAPESVKRDLKQLIVQYDDALDDWLAGKEATKRNPSDAYVAFSAMRMCADFM